MMGENVSLFEQAQRGVFVPMLIVLGILFFACLLRAVKGPRVADRLVSVNMIGTMVMVMIAILSLLLQEEYLLDICLIYAMASFLAVIVLTKVYIGVYEEQRLGEESHSGNERYPGQESHLGSEQYPDGEPNPGSESRRSGISQVAGENETEKEDKGHEHLGMD